MPPSPYIRSIRAKIGHDLLVLQSVTVMLFDDHGRVLLAQDAESGLWMTIGGAVDPDESPADAAVRECWEETGLLVEPTKVLGVFGGPEFQIRYPNGDLVSYVTIVFRVRRLAGEARPDRLEASALRFVSHDDVAGLPMAVWTKEMVTRAFEHQGDAYYAPATWRPPIG